MSEDQEAACCVVCVFLVIGVTCLAVSSTMAIPPPECSWNGREIDCGRTTNSGQNSYCQLLRCKTCLSTFDMSCNAYATNEQRPHRVRIVGIVFTTLGGVLLILVGLSCRQNMKADETKRRLTRRISVSSESIEMMRV